MYEESIRMPLLVKWPGVTQPGSRNESLISNIDFAPTFLDMCGLNTPDEIQGNSFTNLLASLQMGEFNESLYYYYYEYGFHGIPKHEGVFNKRYKLINYYTTGEWELFDLQEDPREMKSVYDDPAYQDVVPEMKKELQKLREKYKVPPNILEE